MNQYGQYFVATVFAQTFLQRFLAQERQNALRLQESESRAASLEEQVRQLRDLQQQLQTRGNALETRVAESSAQQEQLQALYDQSGV